MRFRPLVVFSALLPVALLLGAGTVDQGIQQVKVVNFPEVQRFEGDFEIKGPIAHSRLVRRERIIVPPVSRTETTSLVQVEPIETDGFTNAVLNLQGELKGRDFSPGMVGAVLIPEEDPVLRIFKEEGLLLFPMEIQFRPQAVDSRYFTAETVRTLVGFPRYRLFLYNETDKTAELNFYMYLTH